MRILTLGTFDLFHAGHVALLRRCRDLAGPDGRVIVGLNTDSFVERFKGHPPVVGYVHRETCLQACRYVDAVLPNDQADGSIRDVLAVVRPATIVVGSDWRERDYLGQLGLTPDDLPRIAIAYLPYTEGISSSALKAAMR